MPSTSIERVDARSPLLDDAARLHVASLSGTLTSSRGATTVAGIYRRLVRGGHAVYLAVDGERVLGGLVVMLRGARRATLFTLAYRPWTWLTVARRLGPAESLRQMCDLVAVTRRARGLPPHDYVVALYVDDAARRTGIATGLIARAAQDANARGVGLAVDTLRSNDPASRFYLGFGFREAAVTGRSRLFTSASG